MAYALLSGLPEVALCPPRGGLSSRETRLCPFIAGVAFGRVAEVAPPFLVTPGSLRAPPLPRPGQAAFPGSPGPS